MEAAINKTGRRKTAIARVYLKPGTGSITVNGKDYKEYFTTAIMQYVVRQSLETVGVAEQYDVVANLDGGGVKGQAEALRMGIARALCEVSEENRPALKAKGLLTRDNRMVERKKPGQPKARKRFQFSKR
ncbi:MAG: 30S ribosomal protein S9 [Bacteroidales bacterium]|jgi:small subunit ribosomal protein S9|nr:30S ribosomal protein S9 [Bacteroidales bacterium]